MAAETHFGHLTISLEQTTRLIQHLRLLAICLLTTSGANRTTKQRPGPQICVCDDGNLDKWGVPSWVLDVHNHGFPVNGLMQSLSMQGKSSLPKSAARRYLSATLTKNTRITTTLACKIFRVDTYHAVSPFPNARVPGYDSERHR